MKSVKLIDYGGDFNNYLVYGEGRDLEHESSFVSLDFSVYVSLLCDDEVLRSGRLLPPGLGLGLILCQSLCPDRVKSEVWNNDIITHKSIAKPSMCFHSVTVTVTQ